MTWKVAGNVPSSSPCSSRCPGGQRISRSLFLTHLCISPKRLPVYLYVTNDGLNPTISYCVGQLNAAAHRPIMALFSPMSLRSSRSSHMLGYPIIISSTSTVRRLKPARLIRFDMSRGSRLVVRSRKLLVEIRRACHWRNVGRNPPFSLNLGQLECRPQLEKCVASKDSANENAIRFQSFFNLY